MGKVVSIIDYDTPKRTSSRTKVVHLEASVTMARDVMKIVKDKVYNLGELLADETLPRSILFLFHCT